jgi:hypothetical protein
MPACSVGLLCAEHQGLPIYSFFGQPHKPGSGSHSSPVGLLLLPGVEQFEDLLVGPGLARLSCPLPAPVRLGTADSASAVLELPVS